MNHAPLPPLNPVTKPALTLVSHSLCPYVQRAAILMDEKHVDYERIYIDLGNKPDWFTSLSPLGKVPLLRVNDDTSAVIFESAVILEYLEETENNPLHPKDARVRARHRGWVQFASNILDHIGGFYNAPDVTTLEDKKLTLVHLFQRLENELDTGPWFQGQTFSMVDVAFAPVFRYFDVFDGIGDFGFFQKQPRLQSWRRALSKRPSVINAVTADYNSLLIRFLINRRSALSERIKRI